MVEPGLDRHEWESEMQALEDQLGENPAEALPELDRLREVVSEFLAAREITQLAEKDNSGIGPGDVAAAINGYRAVFDYIVSSRSTADEA
jgi:hypothetical protein